MTTHRFGRLACLIWMSCFLLDACESEGDGTKDDAAPIGGSDSTAGADCEVGPPPAVDCRSAGHECSEKYACTELYERRHWECVAVCFPGERCSGARCCSEGAVACLPLSGGTLCANDSECCPGADCVDGKCTAL